MTLLETDIFGVTHDKVRMVIDRIKTFEPPENAGGIAMKRIHIIIVAAVLLCAAFVAWLFWEPYARQEWPEEERARVAARHRHHGITWSICEGDHCYFYRDGKKVRL